MDDMTLWRDTSLKPRIQGLGNITTYLYEYACAYKESTKCNRTNVTTKSIRKQSLNHIIFNTYYILGHEDYNEWSDHEMDNELGVLDSK